MEQEQGHRPQSDWAQEWEREFRDSAPPSGGPDLAPLFAIGEALAEALRRGLPRELQDQFNSLLREVLLTMRALIDWYLERLDGRVRSPEVEDIKID
ncbi:MAG: hypothetical protein ACRDJY_07720 [Thermoleophilaceae bacterium]